MRTCDGRYFPLQRHAGSTPAEMCKSFCPAAKTMVFSGSKIDTAVASNGTRYADLDNAFAYRDKVTEAAPATARTGSGLARIEVSGDPTLRPGDIVATNDGLATYTGKSRTRGVHADQLVIKRMGAPPGRGEGAAGAAGRKDRARGQ